MRTSRTIKSTQLRQDEIDEAVRMGKFEECPLRHQEGGKLPYGWHGVNVFTVPELKGRRRLITEPLVNACINRKTLPALSYPTRLGRRQALRHAHYMLQIDFEAFYDAIPLPEDIRNNFVFRKSERWSCVLASPYVRCAGKRKFRAAGNAWPRQRKLVSLYGQREAVLPPQYSLASCASNGEATPPAVEGLRVANLPVVASWRVRRFRRFVDLLL
eukprot:gene10498-biopygen7465